MVIFLPRRLRGATLVSSTVSRPLRCLGNWLLRVCVAGVRGAGIVGELAAASRMFRHLPLVMDEWAGDR